MSTDRPTTAKLYANRYRSERLLGKGNFGQVYLVIDTKAKDEAEKQKVLKRIQIGDDDQQTSEGLVAVKEAQLMQKLQHPCIVKFYESFLDGEYFCIVTELCESGDLDVYLSKAKRDQKPLEEQQILTWFVELLCALHYIHSRGVLHRDLKTRNVFIRNGMLKLGDFGISRILMATSDMASTFVGTPYYMSPEVLKHDGYNSKSDIWSLGCILIEMCTLERPFDGTNIMNVMWNIMQKEVPRIPSRFDIRLQVLADRVLDRDPQKRPSAIELLQVDCVVEHVRRMSSNRAIAEIVGSARQSTKASTTQDAALIRSCLNDQVTVEQLRKEEHDKKLNNLDPRERRRVRRQEEEDQRKAQLSAVARENLERGRELKERKQAHLRGTLGLDDRKPEPEYEEARQDAKVNYGRSVSSNAAILYESTAAGESKQNKTLRSNDWRETASNTVVKREQPELQEDEFEDRPGSMLEQLRAQYSGHAQRRTQIDDYIPEDPDMAETLYGEEGFDDEEEENNRVEPEDYEQEEEDEDNQAEDEENYDEEDGDDGEMTMRPASGNDTMRKFENELANLNIHGQVPSAYSNRTGVAKRKEQFVETHDEVDAYGPRMRDTKTRNMRELAIQNLGEARFQRVYMFLKEARNYEQPGGVSEEVITSTLRKLVGRELYSQCFLVDQLVFLESQTS